MKNKIKKFLLKIKNKINKKNIFIFLVFLLLIIILNSPESSSYDDKTTHPALTNEIVDFYNANSDFKISDEHKNLIIQGSIDEDAAPRWLNHFYDPIYNLGYKGYRTSKEWAQSPIAQKESLSSNLAHYLKNYQSLTSNNPVIHSTSIGVFMASIEADKDVDFSWQAALEAYANGNKEKAYLALGHILHLTEDMTVPDHTRNDTHAGDSLTNESSYEKWATKFKREQIDITSENLIAENEIPIKLNSLNEYFDFLANYSNNYFFSRDTIFIDKYKLPIEAEQKQESDGFIYGYGLNENKNKFRLLIYNIDYQTNKEFEKTLYIKDGSDKVLQDYWDHLSRKAILSGAGVIDLFHKEALKLQQEKESQNNQNQTFLDKTLSLAKNTAILLTDKITNTANIIKNIVVSSYYLTQNYWEGSIINSLDSSPVIQNDNNDFTQNDNEIAPPPAVPRDDNQDSIQPTQTPIQQPRPIQPTQNPILQPQQPTQTPTQQPIQPAQNPTLQTPTQQAPKLSTPDYIMVLGGPDIDDNNNNTPTEEPQQNQTPTEENNPTEEISPPAEETQPPSQDATPPNPISDFLVSETEIEGEIILSWTAPGDGASPDESSVNHYEIRQSSSPINEINWADAQLLKNIPAPETPGSSQAFTISNIAANNEYYFAIKSYDSSNNASDISNIAYINLDNISPNPISDFLATTGDNRGEIILSWTAPGDPSSADETQINYYEIRHSLSPIDENNWANAEIIANPPAPATPNSNETFTVSALNLISSNPNDLSDTHYFAIKSYDSNDNISDISNTASAKANAAATYVVISEIKVRGVTQADEFIELYNPTNQDIDISEWSIQYRGSEAENFYKKNFLVGSLIPAYGFFLIAGPEYTGNIIPDLKNTGPTEFWLSKDGGTLFLVSNNIELTDPNSASIIDKVSYGDGTYLFPETEVFAAIPSDIQSLERKSANDSQAESGNGLDQNNNAQDFVLQDNPNPQSSNSLAEPRETNPTLANSDWPMAYQNNQFTNQALGAGPLQAPATVQKFPLSLGYHPAPTIGPNNILYAIEGKYLRAIDATTMTEIWPQPFDSTGSLYGLNTDPNNEPIQNTLTIDSEGNIYFSKTWYIFSVSKSGKLRWYYNLPWTSSPIVIDNNNSLYFTAYDGCCSNKLIALDINGIFKWQVDLPNATAGGTTTPIITNDKIFILANKSTGAGYVPDINICEISKNGELISDDVSTFESGAVALQGVYGDSIIYSAYNKLYKFNIGNKTITRFAELNTGNYINKISIDENTGLIYAHQNNISGSFYVINQDGSVAMPLNDYYIFNSIIDANGNAYYSPATDSNWANNIIKIKAINSSGEALWELNLPEEIDSIDSLIMDSQENLYGMSQKGYLYKFSR